MKHLTLLLIASSIAFSGCSKKEEPVESLADAQAPVAPVAEPAQTTAPDAEMADQLQQAVDTVKESLPEMEEVQKEVAQVVEKASQEVESAVTAMAPKSDPTSTKSSLLDQAMGSASSLAGSVDWSSMSWDKVAEIPYNDKTQLLAWAGSQVDDWKGKLTKAALEKGSLSLANLGDSGWQGALKGVVSSIDQVRESSPETWDLARGALMSAWEMFQTEASKFLGEG